ncbi:uncharacterized protein LOC8055116 [Sorghum bicolor]|uniref:E3 ubiquitin-protein ligase RMA n=1 Tax=Sorghum bicolor TaxID=4558 RepID=C5WQL8_SORBI|nr:uncharacterized protein LOC8055116 [Sorghum bicolor]EER91855.1 hypothetical protein SORBI_3001G281700 [Sorghum bicolor]|eukprot:XP_002464857.1 uncharacterized protein LOC8055116 [Sorghum bicolor]
MAGWTNSTGSGSGSGGGRGSGGRGFMNLHYNNDMFHDSTNAGGGRGRFIGGRSRGRPPQQHHYRFRRVDAVHRDSPPASLSDQQAASSNSSRHARLTHPISTADKSSTSGTAAPPSNREPDDKAIRNAANFECNVCFDIAAEPVVTKCGHLFCWECLYQWLHVHSHHRECPVCKGQVADDAIIPIYGRGGSAASVNNAPPRPTGARVESSRQQQPTLRPFEFPSLNMNPRMTSLREAFLSLMTNSIVDVEMDNSDAMTYFDDGEFYPGVNELDMEVDRYGDPDDDEVYEYDYHFGGVPLFGSAGTEASNPSSSQAHADMINIRDYTVSTTTGGYHHQEFGYSGTRPNYNRGRRGRRNRSRASTDHLLSADEMMVMPGSSGFVHNNNGSSSNVSAGAAFQPNHGWTERRGRSNRNSNSGGGRGGMQDRRRQRTHYN